MDLLSQKIDQSTKTNPEGLSDYLLYVIYRTGNI